MTGRLLDRVVERQALEGHDGRSGALLERVRLDDGTRLVVKRSIPSTDLTSLSSGSPDRERQLWRSGALGRLPPDVGHAIVDITDEDGAVVTVMRDLGDAVPGWTRRLTRAECSRLIRAMTALHRTFTDDVPGPACPLETRLGLLAPRSMKAAAAAAGAGDSALPSLVLRGWERFAEIVDPGIVDAVFAIHADPRPLADALRATGPPTLLHADLWLVNLAMLSDTVVFLDWAIATKGPPALDLAIFLTGCAAHIEPTREELISEFRAHSPDIGDAAIQLALLAELADLGWNKALDATEHPDPAMRVREQADLDWWVGQGRATLEHHPF